MMPAALIFDVFGTVVDWRSSVAAEVAAVLPSVDAPAFATAWRGRYDPAMAAIRDGRRPYTALDILHRENLDATLDEFGATLDEAGRMALNKAWERLHPWPDSVAGLTVLKAHAIIAPCSNGSIALMTRLGKFGGLPWDCILGAEIAQAYKPDLRVYRACCDALRLPPDQVMMVAAHNNDLHAAKQAGLKTAFLPRPTEHGPDQTSDLAPDGDWDMVAADIMDLAAKFGADDVHVAGER